MQTKLQVMSSSTSCLLQPTMSPVFQDIIVEFSISFPVVFNSKDWTSTNPDICMCKRSCSIPRCYMYIQRFPAPNRVLNWQNKQVSYVDVVVLCNYLHTTYTISHNLLSPLSLNGVRGLTVRSLGSSWHISTIDMQLRSWRLVASIPPTIRNKSATGSPRLLHVT